MQTETKPQFTLYRDGERIGRAYRCEVLLLAMEQVYPDGVYWLVGSNNDGLEVDQRFVKRLGRVSPSCVV